VRDSIDVGILVVQRPFDAKRPFKEWAMLRDLKVIVDGEKVGGLRPRQYLSHELADGWHTVRGRMDFVTCRPVDVNVSATEPTFVELSVPASSFWKWLILPTRAVKARIVQGGPAGEPRP
jgi:hypothetical protein